MSFKYYLVLFLISASSLAALAQNTEAEIDSLANIELEKLKKTAKVLHAEPLYIDLIRDLGARKGEKEWNLGLGLTDKLSNDSYEALIEYEWAPLNRLGFEVELPFTFYSINSKAEKDSLLTPKLNSLKLASQWSFFVNEAWATSMAIGYIHEFELSDFKNFGNPLLTGHVFNPFMVLAKRWGSNYHSLLYTGPRVFRELETSQTHSSFDINTSFHYMIPGTKNFIGVEFNKVLNPGDFDMTIRPQMRLGISHNLMLGIVTGVPIKKENERMSSFVRLIWEP